MGLLDYAKKAVTKYNPVAGNIRALGDLAHGDFTGAASDFENGNSFGSSALARGAADNAGITKGQNYSDPAGDAEIDKFANNQAYAYGNAANHAQEYYLPAHAALNRYADSQPNYVQQLYGQTKSQYTDPGMFEKFAQGAMTGDNPAYDYLKSQAIKDSNRQAAARGGFVSGRAMKSQGDMLANLAAQEYSTRAGIAKDAQTAQQDRLGHGVDAAGKSSGEVNDYFKGLTGATNDLSSAQAKTQSDIEMKGLDTQTQLKVAQINKRLMEKGLSAESANNVSKNWLSLLKLGSDVGG